MAVLLCRKEATCTAIMYQQESLKLYSLPYMAPWICDASQLSQWPCRCLESRLSLVFTAQHSLLEKLLYRTTGQTLDSCWPQQHCSAPVTNHWQATDEAKALLMMDMHNIGMHCMKFWWFVGD